MIGLIRKSWQEARGGVLRRDFEDAQTRIGLEARPFVVNVAATFVETVNKTSTKFGELEKLPRRDSKKIAAILRNQAKNIYDTAPEVSYGLALASIYIEAIPLPGDNALYVKEQGRHLFDIAKDNV